MKINNLTRIQQNRSRISANPHRAVERVVDNVAKALKKKRGVNPIAFSCEIHDIASVFEQRNQMQLFNNKMTRFAEYLVSMGGQGLSGILYSILIKFNSNDEKLVEKYATNGLIIAKRQHDPVHIMARTGDLLNIYKNRSNDSKYLKLLYEQKRALKDICNNYDGCKNRFKTLSKEMLPVEKYQRILARVKTEIGIRLKNAEPKLARQELLEARDLLNGEVNINIHRKISRALLDLKNA